MQDVEADGRHLDHVLRVGVDQRVSRVELVHVQRVAPVLDEQVDDGLAALDGAPVDQLPLAVRHQDGVARAGEGFGVEAVVGDDQVVEAVAVDVVDQDLAPEIRSGEAAHDHLGRDVDQAAVKLDLEDRDLLILAAGYREAGPCDLGQAVVVEIRGHRAAGEAVAGIAKVFELVRLCA